ncbi:hypothetical protein [Saccharopolyspora endophytica]|uniref:Uncharacterized protein n=1 Tax=Saccharopolyspora endophytica TaxID=543886 RepID=A0ABS5DK06_9PSEU|nr:hypothetical protein [Saccharopolyspora endophytica]MBQ0926622.1 hypothetical protein [Saccharopolyspora endophytica]
MTILLAAPSESPRMFGLHDYCRSYVLPSEVDTNIPRTGGAGEFGSWNYACGVLVEVSRRLRAAPLSLHYRELETPGHLPMGIEVTAVVDDTRRRISVVSRLETVPCGPRGDYWELSVDDAVPDDGRHSHAQSLPWLVHRALLSTS